MKSVYIYHKHSLTPNTVSDLQGFVEEDKKTVTFDRPLEWWESHQNNLSVCLFYKAED
jgi:hypothetical protein